MILNCHVGVGNQTQAHSESTEVLTSAAPVRMTFTYNWASQELCIEKPVPTGEPLSPVIQGAGLLWVF